MAWIRQHGAKWHLQDEPSTEPSVAGSVTTACAQGVSTGPGSIERAEGPDVPLYQRCPQCAAVGRTRGEKAPAVTLR